MSPEADELAGVVDLFGGLTREELRGAFVDLAARSGDPLDEPALETAIDRAVAAYYLVDVEHDDRELLVAGPAALPRLPDGGEDLPHLVDVEGRSVDDDVVATAALSKLHADAARAVDDADGERVETLLDVCYDLEAWAPVDTAELRARLDAAR